MKSANESEGLRLRWSLIPAPAAEVSATWAPAAVVRSLWLSGCGGLRCFHMSSILSSRSMSWV